MGVYIHGMEFPDQEHIVLVEVDNNGDVFAAYDGGRTKLEMYKAVSLPIHGRLIDAEYLIEHIKACFQNGREMHSPDLTEVLAMIDEIPTIIPAEDSDHEER